MAEQKPAVGIIMGSDSDWPKINGVATALEEFGVPFEVNVMSAHRTPDVVSEYVSSARGRGLKVIIAAAGGAAHLAGVAAAHTTTASDRFYLCQHPIWEVWIRCSPPFKCRETSPLRRLPWAWVGHEMPDCWRFRSWRRRTTRCRKSCNLLRGI